jgi:hypothetical protein
MRWPSWQAWKTFGSATLWAFQAIGLCLTGIGLIFTASQLRNDDEQLRIGQQSEAATLAMQFDDRLSQPAASAVLDAAADGRQILKQDGGASSQDALEAVLDDYNTLDRFRTEKLIDEPIIVALFCHDIEAMKQDAEVEQFISFEISKTGTPSLYAGYDHIAAFCKD